MTIKELNQKHKDELNSIWEIPDHHSEISIEFAISILEDIVFNTLYSKEEYYKVINNKIEELKQQLEK